MKTIELTTQAPSLPELIKLAHDEPVLIRTATGEEFVLGALDDFANEIELLSASPQLTKLLAERRKEHGIISAAELRSRLA